MSDRNIPNDQELRAIDASRHCMEGGTFVTNLSSDLAAVKAAILEYGDPRIVMHPEPCLGGRGIKGWKSLHYLGDLSKGWHSVELGPFWRIVDRNRTALKEVQP